MQRHAVHRRRHAVLAHAVMDVAAGVLPRRRPPRMPLTWVLLEPVRSAEPPISSGTTGTSASSTFGSTGGWPASAGLPASSFAARRGGVAARRAAGQRCTRSNSARIGWRGQPLQPAAPVAGAARARPAAMPRRDLAAPRRAAWFQPSACLRRCASSAPSGAPCAAAVPALLGAPKPMIVRQAIRLGFFDRMANDSARATSVASCPSTRLHRPAVGREPFQRVIGIGKRRSRRRS